MAIGSKGPGNLSGRGRGTQMAGTRGLRRGIALLVGGLLAAGLPLAALATTPAAATIAGERTTAAVVTPATLDDGPRRAEALDTAPGGVAAVAGDSDGGFGLPVLKLTTDGGATWTRRSVPVPAGETDDGAYELRAMDVRSATDIWVAAWGSFDARFLRTTDGGASWTTAAPVPGVAGAPVAVVSPSPGTVVAVVVRKIDSLRVLARSTDTGATWTTVELPDGSSATDVTFRTATDGLAIGTQPGTSGPGRAYRTSDGGASWTFLSQGPRPVVGGTSLTERADGGALAYLSSTGYVVSTDAGSSWTTFAPAWTEGATGHALDGLFTTAFSGPNLVLGGFERLPCTGTSGNPEGRVLRASGPAYGSPVAVGLQPGLGETVGKIEASDGFVVAAGDAAAWTTVQTSADGGTSWTRRLPAKRPGSETIHDVRAWSPTDVTVTVPSGLMRSNDGGATWTHRYSPDDPPMASLMPDADHASVDCETTADGGATWTQGSPRTAGPMVTPLKGMRYRAGVVERTIDGGATWTADTAHTGPVFALDATRAWRTGTNGAGAAYVSRTTDFGATWSAPLGTLPLVNPVGGTEAPVAIRFATATNGWIVTRETSTRWGSRAPRHLFRTTDGGTSWTRATLPSGLATAVDLGTFGTTGLVLWEPLSSDRNDAEVAISTDGGLTWATRSFPSSGPVDLRSVDMADATTGYAVGRVETWGVAYKTTDGGATWASLLGDWHPTLAAPVRPGWPTTVTAARRSDGTVRVTWDGSASPGSGTIDGYRVGAFTPGGACTSAFQADGAPCGMQVVAGGAAARSLDLPAAPAGSAWSVQAHTSTGGWSHLSAPATAVAAAPGAPTGVTAVGGDQKVTVGWIAPGDDGGSPITGYVITPYVGTVAQAAVSSSGTGTTKVVTGLTNGTTYTFTVAATNAAGTGPPSDPSPPRTARTTPSPPTGVTATPVDRGAIVSWTKTTDDGGSPVTGYVVTGFKDGVFHRESVFQGGSYTSVEVGGLVNGTTYTYKVQSQSVAGTGPMSTASNPVTARTRPGKPGKPTAVPGDGKVSLTWTAPASDGGAPITAYQVTPYVDEVAQPARTFASAATTQQITGLANGVPVRFDVAATNEAGTGSHSSDSDPVTPTGSSATVPGLPTGVSGVAGDGQVTVSWSAPSNGGSPITGYVVTAYQGNTPMTTASSTGTGTTKVVTGLANGTQYTFRVAAVNAIGTGAQSASSPIAIPTSTPASPAPFASWDAFVYRQFVDLTAKAPSAGADGGLPAKLAAGTMSKGDVVDLLRRAADGKATVDPTARLYRAFLGRTPDAGGLRFWVVRKRSGNWYLGRIADFFASSNEFKTKYGPLTNRQFVTRIYTDVLGRAADPSGVDYWTGTLDKKTRTRGGVMIGFSESSEYQRKQAENTDVAVAYIFLMGRAPTAAEATDWVTRQKAGTKHEALATELLDSAKYATHVTG
jgi:photosystem II stability/assembly factor-like uncharacterized protein